MRQNKPSRLEKKAEVLRGEAPSGQPSPRTIRTAIGTAATIRFLSFANTDRSLRKQAERKTPRPPAKSTAFQRAPVDPLRYRDRTARGPNPPPAAKRNATCTSRSPRSPSPPPAAAPTSTNPALSL